MALRSLSIIYLLGRHTTVDHLSKIFKKNIAEAPAGLQRLLLRSLKFDVEVRYKQGESIPVADAPSRVYTVKQVDEIEGQPDETCALGYDIQFMQHKSCPISIDLVKSIAAQDQTMSQLKDVIYRGWPTHYTAVPTGVAGLLEL